MSPLATLLMTWAAIYAYVGAYSTMLHVRRRAEAGYVPFAFLCLSLGIWTVGSALGVDATSPDEATRATQIAFMGGYAANGFFCHFALRFSGRTLRGLVPAAYAVAALGVFANAIGLAVSHDPLVQPVRWLGGDSEVVVPLAPVGLAIAIAALALAAACIAQLVLATRERPDLRWLVPASAITLAAAAHDILTRAAGIDSVDLLDHAGLAPVLTVSFLLLRRFARTASVLGERTEELRRSYGELRVTQEVLVRKEQLAAVGELSAVIAHEVRNPLAIIKNATSSLRRASLAKDDRVVLLQILDEEVDRLDRLVRDLLAYARPVTPQARRVKLADIINDAVAVVRPEEESAHVEVIVEEAGPPEIDGDPDLLRHAMANVLENAVSAMRNGGQLTVRTRLLDESGEERVVIEVTDDGAGMDVDTLEKARDPFFTTRPSGTGLGLAIVERVIKNHGGSIAIESQLRRGTTVRITLPRERRPLSLEPSEDDF